MEPSIGAEPFLKNSPFQVTHGKNPALDNTTPELLKFLLQEQHRNTLKELKDDHHDLPNLNLLHLQFLQDLFNSHLQLALDDGSVLFGESSPLGVFSLLPRLVGSESESGFLPRPNYLNLKVLIENSVFDTKNINRDLILLLENLHLLKLLIEDKRESQQYLLLKHTIAQQFLTSLVASPADLEKMDPALFAKIIRLNQHLLRQLSAISAELETLTTRLTNHNLACLVLGYVEDIKITSLNNAPPASAIATGRPSAQQSPSRNGARDLLSPTRPNTFNPESAAFDALFSHIAATAAQRNAVLPEPPVGHELETRIHWAQECIDVLVGVPAASPVPDKGLSGSKSTNDVGAAVGQQRSIQNYKTALNDLRFLHQYLSKEYELLREQLYKTIQDFKRRNAALENEVAHLKQNTQKSSWLAGSDLESSARIDSGDADALSAKDREILRLKKELNGFKIDQFGMRLPANTSAYLLSPIKPNDGEDLDQLDVLSRMLPQPPSSGTSNGILRKEFKKLVGSIQDQYEVELEEERMKRRHLEERIAKMQI